MLGIDISDPMDLEMGEENLLETNAPTPEDRSDRGDQSDLSDGPDLVEQTALQQFASALQDAQRLAVELERDQASQKRKTPKTYQGDSRTTRYRRGKAREALAAKGFLDIRSFLELKQREQYEREKTEHEREREHQSCGEGPSLSRLPASADQTISGGHGVNEGGGGVEDDIVLLPGLPDRAQDRGGDADDEGGEIAGVEGPGATADACGLDPVTRTRRRQVEEGGARSEEGEGRGSVCLTSHARSGRANRRSTAGVLVPGLGAPTGTRCGPTEEEESGSEDEETGEEGTLTSRTRSAAARANKWRDTFVALGPGLAARRRSELAEEEEESDFDEPEGKGKAGTIFRVRRRVDDSSDNSESEPLAGANLEDANAPPRSVTFSRTASELNCDESCETSRAVSDCVASDDESSSVDGNNSEEDRVDFAFLELGDSQRILNAALDELRRGHIPTDLGPLATVDKALDIWNDQDRLQRSSVTLSALSKNTNFDAILRARLTGMFGVLNLYLDPDLQYTWRKASVMVSKIEGKGVNHARMLRQWILKFIQSEELPQPHYSHSRWTVLDDEDISEFLQLQIMAQTKGQYLSASNIVEVVASEAVQEKFSLSGISKPTISERTARRWLHKLNWRFGPTQHGMYLDGHERPDVVAYRKAFVERWQEYEKRFHLWDNDGNELPKPNGFPVPGGKFRLILVTHDESTFYQNDLRKTNWAHASNKATPRQKGDGQSIMVSDFLTSEWGHLCDGEESVEFPFIWITII